MSDPAVEAAKRAVPTPPPNWMLDEDVMDELGAYGTAAAREALKPIREESEQLLNPNNAQMSRLWWDGVRYALEQIAPLIFTTEELER